jgi:hypothetical protein
MFESPRPNMDLEFAPPPYMLFAWMGPATEDMSPKPLIPGDTPPGL